PRPLPLLRVRPELPCDPVANGRAQRVVVLREQPEPRDPREPRPVGRRAALQRERVRGRRHGANGDPPGAIVFEITSRMTSSVPPPMRSRRESRQARSTHSSLEYPMPPWIWRHSFMTSLTTIPPYSFAIEICFTGYSPRSQASAVSYVSCRAASSEVAISAKR